VNKKRPVTFRPFKAPRYAYDKLRICRHCGRYTALGEDRCRKCGRASLIAVEQHAASLARRKMHTRLLFILLLTLASVYFGNSIQQMILCGAGGLVLAGLLYYTQRKVRQNENLRSLNELLGRGIGIIKEGLEVNRQEAVSVLREDDVLAYEKLRELSILLRGDRIARQRVALLHGFLLRKDMDLELEQLLLKDFEPLLAEYIGEIAKVRPDLIKDRTLRYVKNYEVEIRQMANGLTILTSVAGAAVRMKRYALLYSNMIGRYVQDLPKDRFLRLSKLIAANPHEPWNGLDLRVADIREAKYRWDPEVQ
jgi:ribosomal protein L40E